MKIRLSYVSNSSSASFIVTSNISEKRLREIVDEVFFQVWEERAKEYWGVSQLSRRQINATKRDMKLSPAYSDVVIRRNRAKDLEVAGDDYYLDPLIPYLDKKVRGEYHFWG